MSAKPEQPQKTRSAKPRRGGKRTTPETSEAAVSRLIEEVCGSLPPEHRRFVRSMNKERMELAKELRKLRSGREEKRLPVVSGMGMGSPAGIEAEPMPDLASDVLKLLNRSSGTMTQLIREVLRLIAEATGFRLQGELPLRPARRGWSCYGFRGKTRTGVHLWPCARRRCGPFEAFLYAGGQFLDKPGGGTQGARSRRGSPNESEKHVHRQRIPVGGADSRTFRH